jgi:hypothetical protein
MIQTENRKAGPVTGAGAVVVIPFTFKIFNTTDIVVTETNVATGDEAVKVIDTDYVVAKNPDQESNPGGTVTSVGVVSSSFKWTLTTDTPKTQLTDLVNAGGWYPQVMEDSLDKLTAISLEQNEKLDRAVLGSPTLSEIGQLPAPVAGTVLGWDAAGEQIVNYVLTESGSPVSASSIVFTPAGAGVVPMSVHDELVDLGYSVFSTFSAAQRADVRARTGATNVRTAITQALANGLTVGSKTVVFPAGKYYLGSFATAAIIFDLYGYGDGITLVADGEVEFVLQTTASVIPQIFRCSANNRLHFEGRWKFTDTGYDHTINWKGAFAVVLEGTSSTWRNVTIDYMHGVNMVGVVACLGGSTVNRVQNIDIGVIVSENCYYGYNGQNQGDNLKIGIIFADLNYRPYFVYGCHTHEVNVYNRNNRGTSGAINISRSNGGGNTRGIKVKYTARGMTVATTHVLINHIDLLGGVIEDIDLTLDIDGDQSSPAGYNPVRFVNYDGAAVETAAASSNYVGDVRIRGVVSNGANAVAAVATYLAPRQLKFEHSRWLAFNSTIPVAFRLATAGSGTLFATPGWVSDGVQPAIGNGSLAMEYEIDSEGWLNFTLFFAPGTTTTFGTGNYWFTLPFKSRRINYGPMFPARMRDQSATTNYGGTGLMNADSEILNVAADGGAGNIGATAPFAWANGDQLIVSGRFPL